MMNNQNTSVVFQTERLLLQPMGPTQAEAVLEYLVRNRSFLWEWEPVKPDDFYTVEYQAAQLGKELDMMERGLLLKWWISKKEDPGSVIGMIGFSNIVRGAFLSCHLGYRLDELEINQGYITEALRKGIEVVFGQYGLHRIEANIMPRNGRSMRVVEKLGFTEEGLAKKYLKINGVWEDHIHMVLFNDAV